MPAGYSLIGDIRRPSGWNASLVGVSHLALHLSSALKSWHCLGKIACEPLMYVRTSAIHAVLSIDETLGL